MISLVPWIALSIVLYSTISLPVLKWALPLALTVLMLAMGLDKIAPPIWLFLGTSEYDSFDAFHVLRNCWRKCGVTLLNRANPGGSAFYFVQRRSLPLKSLFLDPTAPRVWSLRTRSNMWRNSVLLLIDKVLVVIVDVRGDSDIVRDELDCLRERGLMDKAWFLASDGDRVSDDDMKAIASRYSQIDTSSTRLAGLAALSDAAWSRSGLTLADFSGKTGKRP